MPHSFFERLTYMAAADLVPIRIVWTPGTYTAGMLEFASSQLRFLSVEQMKGGRREPTILSATNWGRGEGVFPTDLEVHYPSPAERQVMRSNLTWIEKPKLDKALDESHVEALKSAFLRFGTALEEAEQAGGRPLPPNECWDMWSDILKEDDHKAIQWAREATHEESLTFQTAVHALQQQVVEEASAVSSLRQEVAQLRATLTEVLQNRSIPAPIAPREEFYPTFAPPLPPPSAAPTVSLDPLSWAAHYRFFHDFARTRATVALCLMDDPLATRDEAEQGLRSFFWSIFEWSFSFFGGGDLDPNLVQALKNAAYSLLTANLAHRHIRMKEQRGTVASRLPVETFAVMRELEEARGATFTFQPYRFPRHQRPGPRSQGSQSSAKNQQPTPKNAAATKNTHTAT